MALTLSRDGRTRSGALGCPGGPRLRRGHNAAHALLPAELARMVDHTLLKPEATSVDVADLCAEASELGVFSVCISPCFCRLRRACCPRGSHVHRRRLPERKAPRGLKAAEAPRAVADGATRSTWSWTSVRSGPAQVGEPNVRSPRSAPPPRGFCSRSSWRPPPSATTRSCGRASSAGSRRGLRQDLHRLPPGWRRLHPCGLADGRHRRHHSRRQGQRRDPNRCRGIGADQCRGDAGSACPAREPYSTG